VGFFDQVYSLLLVLAELALFGYIHVLFENDSFLFRQETPNTLQSVVVAYLLIQVYQVEPVVTIGVTHATESERLLWLFAL